MFNSSYTKSLVTEYSNISHTKFMIFEY